MLLHHDYVQEQWIIRKGEVLQDFMGSVQTRMTLAVDSTSGQLDSGANSVRTWLGQSFYLGDNRLF
jgi:hypothetical protein